MKKIIVIVCLAILLRPVFPVFEYVMNYDYIAKELCVNKGKVILGCNGKCYLVKELARASDSEKPLSTDKKHTAIEKTDLFFNEISTPVLTVNTESHSKLNAAYTEPHSVAPIDSVFRPPALVS